MCFYNPNDCQPPIKDGTDEEQSFYEYQTKLFYYPSTLPN